MDIRAEFEGRFQECVGQALRRNVLLKNYSSFKIGGAADIFFESSTLEEFKAAVGFARREAVPFYVIGGGYNILFADEGYRGLLIRNKAQGIAPGANPRTLEVLSGTPLSRLLQLALDDGLEGFDFLAGIPGTIGGALYSNAGAFGHSIGDLFQEAVFLDGEGNARAMTREDMSFDYRRSILQENHAIILSAVLHALPGDREEIKAKVMDNLKNREKKQPAWGTPCAGSYFKNPILADGTKAAAGQLLEQAGAKGSRVGDAAVFSGHSNFLINLGHARAGDVLALAADLKDKVRAMFGIVLEEEVIYLSESSSMR